MEEFEASSATAAETLAKEFAAEKNDIICGFLKEKEIIELMHREEMNDLVKKFEEEKEYLRHEFELEKEDLWQGCQKQQVEKRNEFQREREKNETKQAKDRQSFERTLQMKYKDEKLKMRQEYEDVIAEKNEEIKMLRRELLRAQHQGDGLTRSSPDDDIYIKRSEHEDELRRASNNFEFEKLELERKCDRQKAEIVQVFANQAERMNANFDEEKQRMQQDHQKELEFKLDVTERLLAEKSDLERKRMIQQFEREITELKESLEIGFKDRLLEKQEALDELEKEKDALLNALHTERFSLAQVYNREISLLTNPDQVTKEDVEVALIDEIAKLKQEHDNALIEMDGKHKKKIEVIKRGQQPTKELELKHRKEIERLKKEFEKEKERLEAEFRKEQFNLLKSFEFERNDLDQRCEEIMNEKEMEIQQKEEDMRLLYEGELDELKSIVEKQREELEVSKQKLGDLAGEMEEFVSEKSRIEERLYKESNQSQNLEQTIDKNLRRYEKILTEAEELHQQEISEKEKEFTREINELKKRLENENLDLQKENETIKLKLEEIQLATENAFVTNSENILESDLVGNSASDEERSPAMGKEKSENVGKKSTLQGKEGQKVPVDKQERVERPLEKKEGKVEGRVESSRIEHDVNAFLHKIREKLRNCIPEEENEDILKGLQKSNKRMKDAISQTIVEIDNLCAGEDEHGDVSLGDEQPKFSIEVQLLALENILNEGDSSLGSAKPGKDQLNEKLRSIFIHAHRCHEVEKIKLKEEHQDEINKLLKEVADEKRVRVQDSLETLRCFQELDLSGDQFQNYGALKPPTEEKGTSTDDPDCTKDISSLNGKTRTGKENSTTPSDIKEELRSEKEDMRRSIEELEKSFMKEKEMLMEKLQTQHKDFVMGADGEIIENLLKQKSSLEDAFNLERFYLSRLYYLEMKEELEDILCRKNEKMKRDFERDKMVIVLKYESEIADLHNLLAEKGEMELRLLQDRNDTMQKLLASQKRNSPERGKAGDRRNKKERLEREKEKLEVKIPLKKEIAELQKKRQQEHEVAVANLKEAFDLIMDIMSSPPSFSRDDDQQLDRHSFVSEDPITSSVNSPEDKRSERNMNLTKTILLSEDDICCKDELKAALENLVEQVLKEDEDSVYDSETTSGASSDLESDDSGPTTVNGESDEGAYSGPESSDGDTLHIKKAELDFVFNLERFNLGRVYHGEYRDSLRKAMKKLAKAKDSLRNKRKDLENDMLSGIKTLVERTKFGDKNRPVSKRGIDADTPEGEQAVIIDHEDRTHDDRQSTKTNKEDDRTANVSRDDELLEDFDGEIENDNIEDKKDKIPEETLEQPRLPGDESPKAVKAVIEDKLPGEVIWNEKNNQDRPPSENYVENAPMADKNETEPESEIDPAITVGNEDSPARLLKEPSLFEEKANEKSVTEQRDSISPSVETTESQGLQYDKEKEPDSGAKIAPKDTSSEKPASKDDKLTTGDEGEVSRGRKAEEEDEPEIKPRNESFEKGGKKNIGKNKGNENQHAKQPIIAETKNLDDTDGERSEPGIKVRDPLEEKPLNKKPEKSTEERGEAFQSNEGVDEDAGERQEIMEEEIKANINAKVSTFEEPFIQNFERPTEGSGSTEEYEDSGKLDSEEQSANVEILTEAKDEDHVKGTKEDERISAEKKSKDRDATEVSTGEDTKALDTESKVREKEEQPVMGKEDESRTPLDEEKWAAYDDDEGECREDNKTEDHAVEPDGESELGNANVFKMKIEPSDMLTKEGEIFEQNDTPENDRLSETSNTQSQTTDEEIENLHRQGSKSPVCDEDLIKQLNRNNKILQDKFNLLRELVGRGFVDAIQELSDESDKEENLIAIESLNNLYAEKEQLTDELKQVDLQMKELSEAGNDNLTDLNKRLDNEEMRLLHSLGKIDKSLKMDDDEKLTEHLLKEKEDVCTKLDEINNLLNEHKGVIVEPRNSDALTLPRLMCKKDVLKDDLYEKARQLNYKAKMLEKATHESGKENQKMKNSLNSLTAQLAALEDGLKESDNDAYPAKSNKELPPETKSLVKSKREAENLRAKLEREIKREESDIGRYGRMLEEQRNRLQPFKRKRKRIQDSLDLPSSTVSNEGNQVSKQGGNYVKDGAEASDKSKTEAQLVDKDNVSDSNDAENERHLVVKAKIEELDFAISNLKLPLELDKEVIEGIPVADILGIVNRVKPHTEEDLKCLDEEILQEQDKLREAGFIHPSKLIEDLEEKENLTKEIDELNNYKSSVDGFRNEDDFPFVNQLKNLIFKKESLEEKIFKLDSEVANEQCNFLDARQFKITGKLNVESESNIKGLLDIKETLVTGLQDVNEKILQSLSVGGLKGSQPEFIEECVERKVKLEDEIEKLQYKIDEETISAAEMLADLLKQKCAINEELINIKENAIEEAKRLQREVSCNADIPEEMNELLNRALLTLEPETMSAGLQEGQELRQRQRVMEESVREKAESLREAKRLEQDPDEVEGTLEQVIREKIPVDKKLRKIYEDQNESKGTRLPLSFASKKQQEKRTGAKKLEHEPSMDGDTLDKLIACNTLEGTSIQEPLKDNDYASEATLSLTSTHEKDETDKGSEQSENCSGDKRRELQNSLHKTENRLKDMLQISRPSDESEKYDLEKLKSLIAEKVKLKEDLRQTKLLEDLLNKKETLLQEQFCGKDAWKDHWERKREQETELNKLNTLIFRRENEMLGMEAKKADKEKRLDKLNNDQEALEEKIQTLKENIDEERRVIEASLEALETTISEQEKRSSEDEQALKQELLVLQDEIESCKKEAEEVEHELNALKKENRQAATPGDVLNLEKLLVEKENLREYLAEIDVTLDNSQTDAIEQAAPTNIEELRKQKKELEIKLEEIREERTKLDVEFEDEEMDEVMKELAKLKNELEERRREISEQIRGSGVLGKLAEKRKERESKMPRYYIEGILDEMARDEKTLTELIKEQEDLKAASQRRRERLEDVVDLVKSKVGENLFKVITSIDPEDSQPDRENEYRPGIDEVQGNEATISKILSDISAENKELRHMNGELNSDLETLKEKTGEELVAVLLKQNQPEKELELQDLIVAVLDSEETLASLLWKQKEEMDSIKDMLGKDLLDSVLGKKSTLDTSNDVDSTVELMAPTIMKKYDEDLQHVIAVYEKELDNLSHENDLLKEKLGKDLSQALLQMSNLPEPQVDMHNTEQDPYSPSNTQGIKAGFDEVQFEGKPLSTAVTKAGNSQSFVEGRVLPLKESFDSDSTIAAGCETDSEKERIAKESIGSHDVLQPDTMEIKEPERQQNQQVEDIDLVNTDTLPEEDTTSSIKQSSIEARLDNIVESYFGSPVRKSKSHFSDEEEGMATGSLKAPAIMRHNGNTLEEVIAQYENDLERSTNETTGGDSLRRNDRTDFQILDDIPEEEETVQGILKAQDKNREILRLLKERLGEDLVYALVNESEEERHLDDPTTDDITSSEGEKHPIKSDIVGVGESKEDDKRKTQEKSQLTQRHKPVKEHTLPEAEEKEDLKKKVSTRTKPAILKDDDSYSGQGNLPEEDLPNRRILKAPSIAIENKKTLADVIASYENGLDSLQSKLGPSLTNTLLSMENPTIGESEDSDHRMKETPKKEWKEEALSKKEQGKADDKDNDMKIDNKVTNAQQKTTERVSVEETYPAKELKAPDIMATSGKTLEEVIEDYEERINEELNNLEKEVSLLKEKLGKDLFHTLFPQPNIEGEPSQTEKIDKQYPKESKPESFSMVKVVSADDDLKAKSLLRDDGNTVENVLRKYERQLEELAKLAPNENNEGISILDLTSNYEDKLADLKNENKAFADRLKNLTEIIGPDLLNKLENMEGEDSRKNDEDIDGVGEDGTQVAETMQKEGKSLEKVVRNYEKELEVLREMFPNQGEENDSISDIIKRYEDKIDDLENRIKSLQKGHDRLVNKIGNDLVGDIETSMLDDKESDGDTIYDPDGKLSTKQATFKSKDEGRLNAPEIMRRDDSTLEGVLETYEKALGLLPRQPGPPDDSFVDDKMHTFHGLMRENKILKDALGDSLATDLTATAEKATAPISGVINPIFHLQGASKEGDETGELNGLSEIMKQPGEQDAKDGMAIGSDVSQLEAKEPVKDAKETIENTLKNYEKELKALRKLVPSEISEGVPVSDLVKEYEDTIEKLETEKNTLLTMLNDLNKNIGPGLMDEMQNFNTTKKESGSDRLDGKKPFDLHAPVLMKNENKTLEDLIKRYENELGALRKLVPCQGEEAGAISDIIRDYEDRLKDLGDKNRILNGELSELEEKIGHGLVIDLKNVAINKAEETESVSETDEIGNTSVNKESHRDRFDGRKPSDLHAPILMENEKETLEGVIKRYENELNALRKLVPHEGQDASAISHIIKDYEDRLEDLADKNKILNDELCGLKKAIGHGLVTDLKSLTVRKAGSMRSGSATDENGNTSSNKESGSDRLDGRKPFELHAPILMENENKTLEGVVERYENELDALRKLVPHQGEEAWEISDIIKDYEDRLEDLADTNQILKDELCGLEKKIGHGLVTDLKNLAVSEAEAKGGLSETDNGNTSAMKMKRTLKAPEIMNEKRLPLENIVATYEQDIYNLEREKNAYKNGLGQGLALVLMQLAKDRGSYSPEEFETYDLPATSKSNKELPDKQEEQSEETNSKNMKQPIQKAVDDVETDDPATRPDELKATDILREEGKDLGKILKNYERELEALRQITPDKIEDGMSISDLINNYEDRFDNLKSENKLLSRKLDNLVETIGQDLYDALDNFHLEGEQGDAKDYPSDRAIDIEVVNLMKSDDRTLQNALKNYEKELIALRKLVPVEQGERSSISDVIKEYEGKLEEIQQRNKDLRNNLEKLEEKIGSNLFKDLNKTYPEEDGAGSTSDNVGSQQKVWQSETQLRSGTTDLKTEKELTLEDILTSQEKDLKDLTKENKALKDGLGPRLAKTLLNVAEEKEMSPRKDLAARSHESKTKVTEEPIASTLPKRGKGYKKQRIDKGSMEDLTKVYAQPFEQTNNDEADISTASPLGDLKAETLIRNEGRTIENILKNHEKEIQTLTELIPSNNGISISDVVAKYEDSIESLENEKHLLISRLDNLEQKIGPKLFSAVENGEPKVDLRLEDDKDHRHEGTLMAPGVMQADGRTLENVVKTYEKELDALRSLLPNEGEGRSINDMVKDYEDKLDQLIGENESLRSDSERLVKRIGPSLANDIQNLEEVSNDIIEGVNQSDEKSDSETENLVKDLKVTKIMDVKKSTLEDVLETYENALGIFLSDSSPTMDELSSESFIDNHKSTIEELKQQNDILKNSLGVSLSQRLLDIAKDDEGSYKNEETAKITGEETDRDFKAKESITVSKHPTQESSQKDAVRKRQSSPGELKAESFVREEGRTIENILKNYEKELEALKSLVPTDSNQQMDAISSLVTKYEDEIDELKKDKSNFKERLEFLESKIGPELMNDMEKQKYLDTKGNEDGLEGVRSELKAPGIMEEENRTLEAVIKCYEKELDALRKLAPNQEDGQQVSISDIIKDYEEKLDELKEKNNVLQSDYDSLTDRLGRNLVKDIQRLGEDDFEREPYFKEESETKGEMKTAETGKQLNAPKIMQENNLTLENILEIYEDTLGFNFDRPDSLNEDTGNAKVTENQLQAFKDLQEEHKILKNTLGETLARNILEMGKAKEREALGHDDDSMQCKDAERHDTFSELAQDERYFDREESTPSDDFKANALLRNKGSTVEDVLKNYEKEIEALSKLIPSEAELGYSISDLIRDYEERIEGLKTKSCSLQSRLEYLTQKIGQDLVTDLESPASARKRTEDDLKATKVAQKDGKTLEDIVRNYEKELEALRKIVAEQGENPYTIADMVQEYQDKVEQFKIENESLKNEFGFLKQRIGSDLIEDVITINSEVTKNDSNNNEEAQIVNNQSKLKAPRIMQEKNATLEDVLQSYEMALSTTSGDEVMSKVRDDLHDKRIENLQRENKVLKDSLGDNLAQRLLEANVVKDVARSKQFDDLKSPTPQVHRETDKEKEAGESEHPSPEVLASELKATALIIDEGRTIENVLRNYERDLEALSRIDRNEAEITSSNNARYGNEILKFSLKKDEQDAVADRVGDPMTSASNRVSRSSDDEIELLKEKVGSDLINELLLIDENDSGPKRRWEAVEKMKEEENTLADILDTYERELERLKREKNAIEALVNDNEGDDQSALDIISQYEDEIEHLKNKNKEFEARLSVLIARIGDNLINDVLSIHYHQARMPRSSLRALEIMGKEERQLSAILEQYENDITKLARENEVLKAIASKEKVDGKPLTSLVSEYERKIQKLLDDKHRAEVNLRVLSEKVGGSLASALLRPGEKGQSTPLDALQIMENERKTLAEVTEQYETDLARIKREIGALKGLVSKDLETSSFMDRILKYQDEISKLNNKIQEQALLEKKVGIDLSRQLTTLDENVGESLQNVTFKAIDILEKDKDTTLADVLKDYEEELPKKEHEILTLKELVSGDILEIATSQENEIDELKKVKSILANELDLISDKIGRELADEIMKRPHQQRKPELNQFYIEIVERMETEAKPLADILEDYEKEIGLTRNRNEELRNRENTFAEVSEKIGKDLLNELLKGDSPEGSQTDTKPLFQALELMSMEEKTLGEVIVNYENELEKLRRENGALRLLPEKGTSQGNSVLDILSNYEEKIEKLTEENREFNKRLQKLSERVGAELTNELLKLPDVLGKSSAESVIELKALKRLNDGQITLAHVLQNYERRLREDEEDDLGPLISGKPITEDVKYAELVRVSESEPEITDSKDEPFKKSRHLPRDVLNEIDSDLYRPVDSKEISPADQEQMKNLVDVNTTLRNKVDRLSRMVGRELAEELMRPPEDIDGDFKAAVKFSSVRDLYAFDDVVTERATLAQVLESYEKQLKETSQNEKADPGQPLVEGRILKEDIKRAHLVRANEYEITALIMPGDQCSVEENICDIGEGEIVRHHKLPSADSHLAQDEEGTAATNKHAGRDETDSRIAPVDLDLTALEDLIWDKPQTMTHSKESVTESASCKDQGIVQEEIIRVEISKREEHFNSEYMEELFGSDFKVLKQEDQHEEPDSKWAEMYLNEKPSETSESDNYELESLQNKVKELEKELEEEKNLKKRYEKDVQDLLQDIVDLKMQQTVDEDDETQEYTRNRIKEEIELMQDNKQLQEDLRMEKKKRLSIEESKKDLLDEVDSLMREKEILLRQQNDAKDNEKLLEDMINLRKKLGELDTENKHLNKEVKELKEALSDVVVNHDDEKNKLLADCEKEKSQMMEELMSSKLELENQLQELLGMNDDLKGTINNLQDELKESSEKLSMEGTTPTEHEPRGAEINNNEETSIFLVQKLKLLEKEANENERNLLREREKNEKLKEQLDGTENVLKQTLTKHQDEIKSIQTKKAMQEDELRKEIEILASKLQLEKESAEQQRIDLEITVQRERERLKEDIEIEHEREKKRLKYEFEDKEEEITRQGRNRSAELEEQWKKEREELQAIFRVEKEKLQKAFDDELNTKITENDEQYKRKNEEMTKEMNQKFAKEKMEITATVEKKIYEQLLDKNITAETDFQEVLSKILQEHAKEIEGVESDIRKAEERFKEDKNKLIEQNDSEKGALKKLHEDEKKALESTIQNLLKEVVRLKQQRKEIRMIHKKEKETMEEVYERDRITLKEDWEQYKRDLLEKLQEDFDKKLESETTKVGTRLEEMKQELGKSEQRRKELEERLKGNAIDSEHVRACGEAKGDKIDKDDEVHARELKAVKKSLEEEYDNKLKEEKRKFEETLQGLRREIGNLQEKRRLIQDKIYNQDPTLVDRNLIEKSIANYKAEILSKMEEEVTQKIAREKKPLEETIKEQQIEIDDLKKQRWELRNQIRRERSKLEDEFDLERERMENQFLREKEELKNKLETRLQREMTKRVMEDKVNRAVSPISNVSTEFCFKKHIS